MAGIYKLTAPNGKCYIGQSFDLDRRLRDYAGRVVKGQRHLYYAVKKYGWDNFKVEVLWRTKHPERYRNLNVLLDTLEIAWIKKFDSVANGYNLQHGGSNGLHSEETKQKIGAAHRGMKRSAKARKNMSVSGRGRKHTKEARANMSRAQQGRKHSEETKAKISRSHTGKSMAEEAKQKLVEANSIPVKQYSREGKHLKTWSSAAEAARVLGVYAGNIASVCAGKIRSAGGFQWRHAHVGPKEVGAYSSARMRGVIQLKLSGERVQTFESVSAAARQVKGTSTSSISAVCLGKRITAGGYKWIYV